MYAVAAFALLDDLGDLWSVLVLGAVGGDDVHGTHCFARLTQILSGILSFPWFVLLKENGRNAHFHIVTYEHSRFEIFLYIYV